MIPINPDWDNLPLDIFESGILEDVDAWTVEWMGAEDGGSGREARTSAVSRRPEQNGRCSARRSRYSLQILRPGDTQRRTSAQKLPARLAVSPRRPALQRDGRRSS
jgi:hypothetical protein